MIFVDLIRFLTEVSISYERFLCPTTPIPKVIPKKCVLKSSVIPSHTSNEIWT